MIVKNLLEFSGNILCDLFLSFIMRENDRSILWAGIIPLTIFSSWIMESVKESDHVFEWALVSIIKDVEDLNMPSFTWTYLSVVGIFHGILVWAHETNACSKNGTRMHFGEVGTEILFCTPVASGSKCGHLLVSLRLVYPSLRITIGGVRWPILRSELVAKSREDVPDLHHYTCPSCVGDSTSILRNSKSSTLFSCGTHLNAAWTSVMSITVSCGYTANGVSAHEGLIISLADKMFIYGIKSSCWWLSGNHRRSSGCHKRNLSFEWSNFRIGRW